MTGPGERATEQAESPLVSVVVATYNRKDDLVEALESVFAQTYDPVEVVVVSNATDGTSDLFDDGARYDRPGVRYVHDEGRMGVAEARNVGYRHAEGEIYVTIDDDAVFTDTDALATVAEAFAERPELGALAFRSVDYETGETPTAEFPHRNNDLPFDEPFETTYFIGVGNALRASALDEVGLYPDFRYSGEELDLSFRLLDGGYRIWYCPDVVVRHKRVQSGRFADTQVLKWTLENRIRVSIRYLPWRYVLGSTLLWTGYALYLAGFDPRPVLGAHASVLTSLTGLLRERSVLGAETVSHLREHDGRLYF